MVTAHLVARHCPRALRDVGEDVVVRNVLSVFQVGLEYGAEEGDLEALAAELERLLDEPVRAGGLAHDAVQ